MVRTSSASSIRRYTGSRPLSLRLFSRIIGNQVVQIRPRHGLLVEADKPRLAALLEKAGKILRRHLPLRTSHPMEITAGALMDKKTAGYLDFDNRQLVSGGGRKAEPFDDRSKRRRDGIQTDLAHESFHKVQPICRDTDNFPGPVVHTQHTNTAATVGESRQFIGKAFSIGRTEIFN